MPIYFSAQKLKLTPLESCDLIELTNLQPHNLKSRKLVGLRNAVKELSRIYYPSSKECDDWKTSWKEGKHFLDCLDEVHLAGTRPKTGENQFYRLLELYEKGESVLGEFLSSLSPPVLLDVICNNKESDLEKLQHDLELYGKECEAVQEPQCRRLRKARERSSKFAQAWAAWDAQVSERKPSVTVPAPPSNPQTVCKASRQRIDPTLTSIDKRMGLPSRGCISNGEAPPKISPQNQQLVYNLAHATGINSGRRTRPLPKRRRVEEASDEQNYPTQESPVSSGESSGYSGRPAESKTHERVIYGSYSEFQRFPDFPKLKIHSNRWSFALVHMYI
ncbi:hypothetical protein ONS96_003648 [Cadophora gregata f. sp. sojae]|nr:hypothetical protein ONS96_003648 [Cadophora gregata f. sp. sojae]